MTQPRSIHPVLTARQFVLVFMSVLAAASASAQQSNEGGKEPPTRTSRDSYLMGEQQGLEMVVHVLGEVKQPGEYRVPDDTDVVELISKAGGPTELANLGSVTVRRHTVLASGKESNRVFGVDVSEFLNDEDSPDPPQLAPSDVVMVPRNKTAKWRTAFAMIRDVSVVATAYLLYLRVEQND